MNMLSFADELVRVSALRPLIEKHAYAGGAEGIAHDTTSVDIPHSMAGSEAVPESIQVAPDEAATRLPETAHLPSIVQSGHIGGVAQAKDPIDRFRYNRAYQDRR